MNKSLCVSAVVTLATLLGSIRVNADPIGDGLALITQKVGPAIVSIRSDEDVTVQAQGKANDQDITIDFHGVAISADGLIMCSNTYFSGDRYKEAHGVASDSTDVSVSIDPRTIQVTIGDEPSEYYATIAASDSNLGLEFLQIRDLKGRTLPFVDLTAAATAFVEPVIGEPTVSVTRLDKDHGYATLSIEDRIAAILDKPRRGYLPEGDAGGLGLPVSTIDGSVIGVITSLPSLPSSTEDIESDAFARLYDDDLAVDRTEFIVPVTNVSPVVALAKARAAALPPFVPPVPKPAAQTPPPASTTTTAPTAPVTKPVSPATGSGS